ncbi:MAG: GNAT family N-acetyltransferase [Rhodospirillaceae bacterium]|nr:GNAT family N-acetyltransferase [Rhodospirillales bacterium]
MTDSPTLLWGVSAEQLFQDVLFNPDYLALHAGVRGVDSLALPGFRHATGICAVGDGAVEDLETPWGYGGPVAADAGAMDAGMAAWRAQQRERGRVAEFVRLHPFINPMAVASHFDMLAFDRPTVVLDLSQSLDVRRSFYNRSARRSLKKAEECLTVRQLGPDDGAVLQDCYEAGLKWNDAAERYWLEPAFYGRLLAAPWCMAWAVEFEGRAVAALAIVRGGGFVHTHLAGNYPEARDLGAAYILHQTAIDACAQLGDRWFHFGGGRSRLSDDVLLQFKAKFSPLRAHYYVGGLIFDRDAYAKLGGASGGMFLGYRSPITAASNTVTDPTPDAPLSVVAVAEDHLFDLFGLACDPARLARRALAAPPDWSAFSDQFERLRRDGAITMVCRGNSVAGFLVVWPEAGSELLCVAGEEPHGVASVLGGAVDIAGSTK